MSEVIDKLEDIDREFDEIDREFEEFTRDNIITEELGGIKYLKWKVFFSIPDVVDELNELLNIIENYRVITPEFKNIFKPFIYRNPANIKAVIFTNDPPLYFVDETDIRRATGLGVSLPLSERNLSKEIKHIHDELEKSYSTFKRPTHGSLVKWAEQGVLLLNCRFASEIDSKKESFVWLPLIYKIIKFFNDNSKGICYMLWCSYNYTKNIKALVANNKKFLILESCNPFLDSFVGNNHFLRCNEFLKSIDRRPIKWERL